ncbi:hypothetical protein H3N91_000234 [Salmonella enterica]|nr:hypothetical protein [Salmonella enterica]EEA2271417.1 hypothetical protein [Salmonella enterica]EFV5114822.1 hypothetical protein [Salmonella enterica]EGB7057522.1 hypothetical protein [Salmonella enterica]EKL9523978.1 hypothetical protein [Salmonella enterica]
MKIDNSIDFDTGKARAEVTAWRWEADEPLNAATVVGRRFFEDFEAEKVRVKLFGLRQKIIITGYARTLSRLWL